MIEVEVSSIRVSLMNQQRIVVLKDINEDRFLPIWIGQFEAEAITIELQEPRQKQRPLTHDLLKSTIESLGGELVHIYVNDIRGDIYYAKLVIRIDDRTIEVDSRPSDAIALAVRAKAPIFVSEAVMERSAVEPEEDVDVESSMTPKREDDVPEEAEETPDEPVDESQLGAFADFVNSLDLDELDDDDQS